MVMIQWIRSTYFPFFHCHMFQNKFDCNPENNCSLNQI
uniref:Uncharacterized protein n=1 Tax=Populus trichocarpa TaxID=3694 RepID=A0A3N7FL75_POPTR